MTNEEIHKFGEIQYLKGRLDELHKAFPTVSNINRQRKLDQRMEKYYEKLKKVDEVAYFLYMVELKTRLKSKNNHKLYQKSLLRALIFVANEHQSSKSVHICHFDSTANYFCRC